MPYTGIETNGADSNPDPPHLPVNEDPLDGDTNNKPDSNADNEDDDHGDVDGPTMQAHVDLSKISCKYCIT
jgi:hypothetical protein